MAILFIDNETSSYDFLSSEEFVYTKFRSTEDLNLDCEMFVKNSLLEQHDISVIILPIALKNDYLECSGLCLAHHIRLSKEEKINGIKFIFLTDLSISSLFRLSDLSAILFTTGVSVSSLSKSDLKTLIEELDVSLSSRNIRESYFKYCKINPPLNYESNHSKANEWSLYRIFKMIPKDPGNEKYSEIRNKINTLNYLKSLHFKYLESLYVREGSKTLSPVNVKINELKNTNIALIDDDFSKGWKELFDYLCYKSGANLFFYDFSNKFENSTEQVDEIFKWCLKLIIDCDIAFFIIDLRIHFTDFEKGLQGNNLSGFKLIEKLKNYNPGIQILCLTASNKSWNIKSLYDIGIKYIVNKEDPTVYFTKTQSYNQYLVLEKGLKDCARYSKLRNIVDSLQFIKVLVKSNTWSKSNDIKTNLTEKNGLLDQVLVQIPYIDNPDILSYILLQIFNLIEVYKKYSLYIIANDAKSIEIININGENIEVIKANNTTIISAFELVRARYSFCNSNAKDTLTNIRESKDKKTYSDFNLGLDAEFNIAISSILIFRHKVSNDIIRKLIELRYLRSNIAAHLTGNVDPTLRKIQLEDIEFLLDEVVSPLFCNNI